MAEKTTNSEHEQDQVLADIEPASKEGFVRLLQKANAFLRQHPEWRLLTLVRLEKTVSVVYVRISKSKKTTEFWEEDDQEA